MDIKLIIIKLHNDLDVLHFGTLHEVESAQGMLEIESLFGIDCPQGLPTKIQLCCSVLYKHPHKSFHSSNFDRFFCDSLWKVIHI
jgi:hypothetical protein